MIPAPLQLGLSCLPSSGVIWFISCSSSSLLTGQTASCVPPQASLQLAFLQGIKRVPTRLRIQISRRRNDDEDAQVNSAFQLPETCDILLSESRLRQACSFLRLRTEDRGRYLICQYCVAHVD